MTEEGLLLELAAADDVAAFKLAVEQAKPNLPLDSPSPWYGRWPGPSSSKPLLGFQQRTPLMVASLFGSVSVVEYLLTSMSSVDVSRRCGTDLTTALHCAAAGGSDFSLPVIRLLLDAAADVNAVDAFGNRPVDVIPRQKSRFAGSVSVEVALGGDGSEFSASASASATSSPMTPKKEYPIDATLPDIKSGIYGTDEFRMYTFKVKPCSRAYSHDWTECPFVHPGENARRRDPRKYHYSCVPCPEFRKGACRNGDSCEYAHGVFESWLHPAQYRTRLCKDETGCNRRVCFFAHKPDELRPLYPPSPSSPRGAGAGTVNLPPLDLAAALLMNQPMSLSSSRLKSSLSARDMELDYDLISGGYQQKLMEEIGNLYGSPDSTLMSPLKGLSFKPPFQPPTPNQKQLLGGSGGLPPAAAARSSSPALASALMNSRASAFAKRSQSFVDRGAMMMMMAPPSNISSAAPGWGSPNGKLDWGIEGEELSKLRKSASFGIRSNANVPGERDGLSQNLNNQQFRLNSLSGEFSPWTEQFYLEQEQMVA